MERPVQDVDILSVLSATGEAIRVQDAQPNSTHRAETWHDLN